MGSCEWVLGSVAALLLAGPAGAERTALSDPAATPAPPRHAVGFPSRAPDLDALPGFQSPPPGYGEVAFFWWVGDPLTRERLTWQLDRLAGNGVEGLQVNYAHSDRGGTSYGLTYPSDPKLFSPEWWELYGWFLREAKRRGMSTSLSDYTLGIGQGWAVDEALAAEPEIRGAVLESATRDVEGGALLTWELPLAALCVRAYPREGEAIGSGESLDLASALEGRRLTWRAPAGSWRAVAVWPRPVDPSIDPMHPRSGRAMVEHFFQPFETHNPGEGGRGLNFFFSDELGFRVRGWLWDDAFAGEFRRRKGYDVIPELASLFVDTGPRTPKVRLDVNDVIVALSEEHYFGPVFAWHQERGMLYGCDHGGRGYDLTEFGDYFRTQRWNQGPGCDQPGLSRDVVKNKVASSISHLYERPRTWLEGYHSSGWATSSADVADATFANFAMGQNLLTLHGLYYSTHGGWWEWAPPCNHWRMPYWEHMATLLRCTERLSYLLSQGTHVCDVAVVYPVATLEAGVDGGAAAETAFDLGRRLYGAGTDFDYMDFESLDRATIRDGRLEVAGESYRALLLPAMKAVRHSTLEKAHAFARAGGIVLAVGALPEASDRVGRDDPEVARLVAETFHEVPSPEEAVARVRGAIPQDLETDAEPGTYEFLHRRVGPREVYALHGLPRGAVCRLRATGRVELWDPWTGETRPLPVLAQEAGFTRLRLPLGREEMQLTVFSPGEPLRDAETPPPTETATPLEGAWECEVVPTLDNRWGDFRWPPTGAMIGPEARRLRCREETEGSSGWEARDLDDSAWRRATCGFGPQFLRLGPLPVEADPDELERVLAAAPGIAEGDRADVGEATLAWAPYEFSWRQGVEGDPGHQGYHGLKEEAYGEFLRLGQLVDRHTDYVREAEPAGTRSYLWTTVRAPRTMAARLLVGGMGPAAVWVRGVRLAADETRVLLRPGPNPVLLRYDTPGAGYALFVEPSSALAAHAQAPEAFDPATRWVWSADTTSSGCALRTVVELPSLPEGARLHITADNGYTLRVNGTTVGSGGSWTTVDRYDVRPLLRAGPNVLAVEARNEGGSAGVIAELVLTGGEHEQRVGTDATWRVAAMAEEGWLEAPFDASAWQPATEIAPFRGSLWHEHPQGPPRLVSEPGPAAPTVGTLAMPWWGQEGILPFDARGEAATPATWFRCEGPPGLRELTVTALGRVRAWVDGAEVRGGPAESTGAGHGPGEPEPCRTRFRLPEAVRGASRVVLRVEHPAGCYGGTVLPEPVAFTCERGALAAGDWSRLGGLETYSGGMWYRRNVRLTPEETGGSVTLDLGSVVASAEVRVNGKPAGVRVAPPWRWEITELVRPGDNRIEVLVYNTLANHYRTIPTRYGGSPTSGLLGPAVLRIVPEPSR